MSTKFEVHIAYGRVAGPFAVIDTALNRAVELTRPPPPPPKQYTHLARTLKTTDTDPYELLGTPAKKLTKAVVIELGDYGKKRTRAFVEDGRVLWAKECKPCGGTGGVGWGGCPLCGGSGVLPDRSCP